MKIIKVLAAIVLAAIAVLGINGMMLIHCLFG